MKLYIGGAAQGKLALACLENGFEESLACRCESCEREDIYKKPLIYGLHEYVRRFVFTTEERENTAGRLKAENPQAVIICDEVGCGVVPVDRRERECREITGRLLTELAADAGEVVRVFCGIGKRIKSIYSKRGKAMTILLLRHGKTAGNEESRYVGSTDEELSATGIKELLLRKAEGKIPLTEPEIVFVSPMRRCGQTAELLFPKVEIYEEKRLTECDFGAFEYKNYKELSGREDYQAWIDSGGKAGFPGGEALPDFKRRSIDGFVFCVHTARERGLCRIAFVIHGGTIMSVMEGLAVPKKDYYSWQVKNLAGFLCTGTPGSRMSAKLAGVPRASKGLSPLLDCRMESERLEVMQVYD